MSLRYLLDTNIISAPFKAKPNTNVLSALQEHTGECAISVLTWHELRFGYELMAKSRRKTALGNFINTVILTSHPILPYNNLAADWHAKERARLRLIGREPPIIDAQIAAVAAVNGLILVTNNTADFAEFQDLPLEDWLH